MLETFLETIQTLWQQSAFCNITWQQAVMLLISFFLMYLAIVKQYEPMLMLPIAFGMALTNLPGAGLYHPEFFMTTNIPYAEVLHDGGILDVLYLGVKCGIFPPLIFLGIGCMTDFGPLIANPKSFFLGAAAQGGIFFTFLGACALSATGLVDFSLAEAASIAVAAYSYMALVPVIQPPIMKVLTTKKERKIKMGMLRSVSRTEKIIFPIAVTIIVAFIVPSAAPLVGMLMLGNLFKESGVVDRLVKTASGELMNIIVIMLGTTVGATATAENFLSIRTIMIVVLGLLAFCVGTACGVLLAKLMNKLSGGTINPLIGSAGVSAVPMAARVSQKVGQEEDPSNFLLMHAMGPNVAGVIGSAVAAGALMAIFG